MAMGQAEQRAIHPFFRKDFGAPAPIVQPNNAPPSPSEPHESIYTSETSAVALDHDPNADRRKRRKTSRDASEEQGDHTKLAENELKHPEDDRTDTNETAPQATPKSATAVAVETPSPEQGQPQPQLVENLNPVPDEAGSKKQKVIKLNTNGKLLSSPVADKFADKSKKGNRRGRPAAQKDQQPESKLVVISYSVHDGIVEDIGQQINEILSGKRKHTAPKCAAPLTTAPPAPASNQPPKATHPFFMKKPVSKPDATPSQPVSTQTTDGPKHEFSHSQPASKPLSSFKHAFTRVPEPMHALWPPLGLTHVRHLRDELLSDEILNPPDTDLRKSKSPAVQVKDDESVLSFAKNLEESSLALRIPKKQISSGRVLQAEIAKRLLSQRADVDTDMTSHDSLHPAISKLYTSLLTSMTPFERGEYEAQLWVNKYAPTSAQQVLCATKEALMLRDWLKHLIVSSVEMSHVSKNTEKAKRKEEKKRKRRKKAELDDFIVDSEEEANEMGEISGSDDELAGDVTVSNKRTVIRTGDLTFNLRSSNERGRMTNAILLSGPSGCGKTASVYAVAKEMDFEVFEINAGSRRSAKDILDRIGDMTQNHLVHNLHDNEDPSSSQAPPAGPEAEDGKQNNLKGFFQPTSTTMKPGRPKTKGPTKETHIKQTRSQKQSLILLEEADILFEEDKSFWTGVFTLIHQSKRPIVITCSDENLVPLDDISFHAILRFRAPSQDLAVDYLLLMAANEGHILERESVEKLYLSTGNDLRRSIMDLNYWCQMAVGSEKSGLDWLLDRWPQGIDLDSNGDKLRVLSEGTYNDHMGWFSRDVSLSPGLTTEAELRQEALHWWQLSLQDADTIEDSQQPPLNSDQTFSKFEQLQSLRQHSEYLESRSALDLLASGCSLDIRKDAIDTSIPPILEKQKLNYIECYRLLHADLAPDYTALTAEIGSTFQSLLGKAFRQIPEAESKNLLPAMLESVSKPKPARNEYKELLEVLAPAMRPDCAASQPGGSAGIAFEHGQRSIVEDLTPYLRGIVAFDLRLEQYRRELSHILTGNERGTKRMRTTRASRAALEGGNKAETRKERWLSAVNVHRALATGKRVWQDLLVQNGFFSVPIAREQVAQEESEQIPGSPDDVSI